MRYLLPDYYEQFSCTGKNCRDNCCIGWEIMVDDASWENYQKMPAPWPERFRCCIAEEGGSRYFILQEGRCPFLNSDNCCDIIATFGEDALCDICDEHPRFTIECSGWMETGLGLCCEEAARLILSQTGPAAFLYLQDEQETDPLLPSKIHKVLEHRWKLFALLQNRCYPLSVRLNALIIAEDAGPMPNTADFITLAAFLKEQEYLTPQWPEILQQAQIFLQLPSKEQEKIQQDFENVLGEQVVEYEQLAVYFLFRYYLSSIFDGRPTEKVRLTAAFVRLIEILALSEYCKTGSIPDFSRRLRLAQIFSKEVEYNDTVLEGCKKILSKKQ